MGRKELDRQADLVEHIRVSQEALLGGVAAGQALRRGRQVAAAPLAEARPGRGARWPKGGGGKTYTGSLDG